MAALAPLLVLALFIFGGLQTYIMVERRHRPRWVRLEEVPDPEPDAGFRTGAGPGPTKKVMTRAEAPRPVRRLALWSLYMGQMSIPGGFLGLLGLLVAGIGVVAVPGMVLAIRIWRLGLWLLRRDERAEREAEALATFAVGLNIIAVFAGFVVAGLSGEAEALVLPLFLMAYGAVSVAHAFAMRRVARLLADERHRDEAETRAKAEARAKAKADAHGPGGPTPDAWDWARPRATRPVPRA